MSDLFEVPAAVLLTIIIVVVVVIGAPLYLLARVAVMLDNLSLGLPANYGFGRKR